METIKSWLQNDIVERSAKTFVQAFISALVLTGWQLNKTTLVAAGAAAVSAVWNYLKTL